MYTTPINKAQADALFIQAKQDSAARNYTESIQRLQIAAQYYLPNQYHEDYIHTQIYLSQIYHNSLQHTLSKQLFKAAIPYAIKYLGKQNSKLATLYSNYSSYLITINKILKSRKYIKKAIAIFLQNDGYLKDKVNAYINLGTRELHLGYHNKALYIYEQALSIDGVQSSELEIMLHYQISLVYYFIGNYELAMSHSKKVINSNMHYKFEANELSAFYKLMAIILNKKGDYGTALQHSQHALSLLKNQLGIKNPRYIGLYNTIAVTYINLKEYDKAKKVFKKILRHTTTPLYQMQALGNLGNIYHEMKHYEKSIQYVKKSINICLAHRKQISNYKNNIFESREIIASCYFSMGNYDRALSIHQKNLSGWLSIHPKHLNAAQSYANIAEVYRAMHNYETALSHLRYALNILCYPEQENNLDIPTLPASTENYKLLDILFLKSQTLFALYKTEQNPQYLPPTLAHYLLADQLIDQMRSSFQAEESKVYLAEKAKEVYERATEVALVQIQQQNNTSNLTHFTMQPIPEALQHAFHFFEKSKAMVLLQQRRSIEARLAAEKLPANLREQEEMLIQQIQAFNHQISQEELTPEKKRNQSKLTEWKEERNKATEELNQLKKGLKNSHYNYWHFKYNTAVATIAELQATLDVHTALVSYFVGSSNIYYFVITPTTVVADSLPKPSNLVEMITQYKGNLEIAKGINNRYYIESARQCYQQLVLPIIEIVQQQSTINRIIIIPDDVLCNMSFGALLTEQPLTNVASNLPYLEKQYRIDYHYSATLWLDSHRSLSPDIKFNFDFAGFAPVYRSKDENPQSDIPPPSDTSRRVRLGKRDYETLPYSEAEAQNCSEVFKQQKKNTTLYLHQEATLRQFKDIAPQTAYLLIAAHTAEAEIHRAEHIGIILSPENETSEPGFLNLPDIYTLSLANNLVVLSCCNTGVGTPMSGEGALSISRGFLYAGAQGVIYTLFRIDDQPSSQFTPMLFRHLLKENMNNISQALHETKLAFINDNMSPAYWAGFAFIGH